jgi:type VI secretion system protein ImpD
MRLERRAAGIRRIVIQEHSLAQQLPQSQTGQSTETQETVSTTERPAGTDLLNLITATGAVGQGSSAVSSALMRFLDADIREAFRLWIGKIPREAREREHARRILARDIGRIDRLLTEQVNEILHHPDFQQLESAWRGLHYVWRTRKELLTERGLDDKAADIEIRVLSVSRKELRKDFEDAVDFDQNNLFKKVYEEEFGTAGGHPYGLLLANYEFTNHPDDIDLLGQLSGIGAASFAPVIAAASPALLGLDDFSILEQPTNLDEIFQHPRHRKWRSLREKPDSQFLGLTMPRILMRAPWRNDGMLHQGFCFEETVETNGRKNYLWGSSAWAMGAVVMRAFATSGWFADIRGAERGVESGGLVTGLETLSFDTDAEGVTERSSVEVAISDLREAELCRHGFIPLSHCKGTPYSVFYSNQSVHQPEVFDDAVATANARVSAMLQYVLCCSRIAHYLKVKARDKIGSVANAREIENELGEWLVDYVTPDERASPSMKARFPLREAEVRVEEAAGEPGKYFLTIRLLPHYQLDQLSSAVTLVARRLDFRE